MPITSTSSRDLSKASRSGISFRQGLHQVAQKFTTTHLPRRSASVHLWPAKVSTSSVGNSFTLSGDVVVVALAEATVAGGAGAAVVGAGAGAWRHAASSTTTTRQAR